MTVWPTAWRVDLSMWSIVSLTVCEAALLAVGIIGDDVDAGDLRHGVHRDVVIGDGNAQLLGEATAIAYDLSRLPHLIDHACGILHGHAFLIELGALAAYHVEQDAKTVEFSPKAHESLAYDASLH